MEVLSPLAELWYNSYHTSLGCSPFKALDGVEPKTGGTSNFALQLLCPNWWRTETCPLQSLRQHLANAHNRMKTMAAKKRSDLQFQVRDQVLLKLQPYTPANTQACLQVFCPLQNVLERVGMVAYRLELSPDTRTHHVFRISQLKPSVVDYCTTFQCTLTCK